MSQSVYGAHFLPCGKYARDINTSCSTECPHLSNDEIEQCYEEHKKELIKTLEKFFKRKLDEDWYIYRDIYFFKKLNESVDEKNEDNTKT